MAKVVVIYFLLNSKIVILKMEKASFHLIKLTSEL